MDKMNTRSETGSTSFFTPSEEELVVIKLIDAPRRLVWDAHTQPQHIAQWMTAGEGSSLLVCEIDLRPSGQWHILWQKADSSKLRIRGTYGHISPLQRLVNTESWGAGWPETLHVRVFAEEGGRTKVTTTILYPSSEARERAIAAGVKLNYSQSYDRLATYLTTFADRARRAG